MAIYGTDLTLLTNAELDESSFSIPYTQVWTEFASPYNSGGTPAEDSGSTPANYIQGQDCWSQSLGTKTGLVFSVVWDAGSDISGSFATDDVFLMWQYFAVGSAVYLYADGGMRIGVGSDTSNIDVYASGGSDRRPNPYGGWQNIAIDPTRTADYTVGTGNGGAWRYFGSIMYTKAQISKGTPHAVDSIMYGRGELYCTGTGCTFTGFAEANDQNGGDVRGDIADASAVITNVTDTEKCVEGGVIIDPGSFPVNTTIVSVDSSSQITVSNAASGNHTDAGLIFWNRFGLFQDSGGTYLWKGLLSFGQSGASATFSDSNKTIVIDDAAKTYAAFNKIEINHASTSVTWNNISFISTGTVSPGRFEMVDNATVAMDGCLFVEMDTFIFQSNATVDGTSFVSCGQITHGGADFDSCVFQGYEGTVGTAYMTYAIATDPNGEMDNCSFTKGTAATHAIEFDATNTPTTITLTGIDFSGYHATHGNNDSALYFPSTSKSYTVNLIGCTGDISYRVGSGGSVTLVINPVALTLTYQDINSKAKIQGVAVTVWAKDGTGPLPFEDSVAITQTGGLATVVHSSHGLETGNWVEIEGVNENNYNRLKQITKIDAGSYSFPIDSGTASPATGTPIATAVIINALTDVNGEASDTRSYPADQPWTGKGQKGTREPVYVDSPGEGVIDKDTGDSGTFNMIPD